MTVAKPLSKAYSFVGMSMIMTGTGVCVDWIRVTLAVWKRPQVMGGVPSIRVRDIGYDVNSVAEVGIQPAFVSRWAGLLDCWTARCCRNAAGR